MRFGHLLNPNFVYRNRDLILPYLERRWKFLPLKNAHSGERCFVIGNGPSLLTSDLELLKSEVTFASNKIYLAFDQTEWRPTYYVVEDDHLIRENHNEISRIENSVKFVRGTFRELFPNDPGVIFFNHEIPSVDDPPKFGDPLHILYCGFMVTYISLQLAYFMGFSNVYLLGVDFSYSLLGAQRRPTIEHGEADPHDHFVPNYFKPGEKRYLPLLGPAERAMRCARDHFEANGRKIWNATRGGKLEVFPRVSFDELITERK